MKYSLKMTIRRALAFVLDSLLVWGIQVWGLVLGGFLARVFLSPDQNSIQVIEKAASVGAVLGVVFWGQAAWLVNYGVMQGFYGYTFGKWCLNLRVGLKNRQAMGFQRAVARTLAYWLSAAPIFLGFVMPFFRKDRKTLHDLICSTEVVSFEVWQQKRLEVSYLPQSDPLDERQAA